MPESVILVDFESYAVSAPKALEAAGLAEALDELARGPGRVLLKPNLVTGSAFPVTTHPALVEAVVLWLRERADLEIIIAEGAGAASETADIFATLGYVDLARRLDVELLDLNHAPSVRLENPACRTWPELYLPKIAVETPILNLPVCKAHSLAVFTGGLKNMMGLLPPEHYGSKSGWKKSKFHARMQESLTDLGRYIQPWFTLLDASVGMMDYHLGGRLCDPPLARLLAGFDALAVDRAGCALLGLDWRDVGHLR